MRLQPLARAPGDEVQRHQAAQGVCHNGGWPPPIAGHCSLYQLRQVSKVPFLHSILTSHGTCITATRVQPNIWEACGMSRLYHFVLLPISLHITNIAPHLILDEAMPRE